MPVLTLSARDERPADVPRLDEAAAHAVVERFRDLVTQLSLAHGVWSGWWYSWLSSRDRHNSRVLEAMMTAERARRLFESPLTGGVRFACPDPLVAAQVASLAQQAGWTVRRSLADRTLWAARRVLSALVPWIAVAKLWRHGVRGIRAARRRAHEPGSLVGCDALVVTILDHGALPKPGREYTDTYFGALPAIFSRSGIKTLVLGQAMGEGEEIAASVAAWHNPTVCTPHHLTGLPDVISTALRARPVPRSADLPGPDGRWLAQLVRADLRRDVVSRGFGFLIERAMARALAQNPNAQVLHMYENNPWERAVTRAAHAATPRRIVTGYLHCAVLPAHLKNYIAPEEIALRPAPDRVVCTGPAAREVFLSLGAHDPARVAAGCALRDAGLHALATRGEPPRRIAVVLVVLEGLEKMVGLLRFADAAAALNPGLKFVVREHPALGLARLAPLAGVAMGRPGGLQASTAPSLAEALEEADAVLYQGTTAAMTAGAAGIPLLRFRSSEVPTDDPLFACPALKRELGDPAELAEALRHFEEMDGPSWRRELGAFRAYVESYLAPTTDQSLAVFGLPPQPAREAAHA